MPTAPLSVVIQGHFYQPPREDPWLETVEAQTSAAPFHDWNERVMEECYRAIVAARLPGTEGRIERIVNTLESISFNFGPTLLEWIEGEAPGVYRSILEADAESARRLNGHGNAMAQAYHHTILPLASRREKVTEIRWGIADFRKRFGRDPEGMWLPETAVDASTLDVLAQEGIAFTIVAPHQVSNAPPNGLPGLYRTSGGRSVAIFVYNGPLSHGVAFGSLLDDAEKWALDMASRGSDPTQNQLISIATDGETYGHHHRFGEMALAAVLQLLHGDPWMRVENFASFLERNPPEHEVELVEPSSWSCSHGVDRWRLDCGCKMDPTEDTQQEWRAGLRSAIEWLASEIHLVFETEGAALLGDPWEARDRYGPSGSFDTDDARTLELLEAERNALRLFTSCGWFFDDLSGLEPIQLLRYAARALELLGPGHEEIEEGFLSRLELPVSNEAPPRAGREIYLEEAVPQVPAHLRVAAGAALWEAVSASARGRSSEGSEGNDHGAAKDNGKSGSSDSRQLSPGVPGYRVERITSERFLITQQRTLRKWEVETRIRRPTLGRGSVAVRESNTAKSFVPLSLRNLPEGFRIPITTVLTREVRDPARVLTGAVRELETAGQGGSPVPSELIRRIRDLADLHLLLDQPIPFDAQNAFFRILDSAPAQIAVELTPLREPLGFTAS